MKKKKAKAKEKKKHGANGKNSGKLKELQQYSMRKMRENFE